MKYIVPLIILFLVTNIVVNISNWSRYRETGQYEYWQMIFLRNKNDCVLPEFGHTVKVSFGEITTGDHIGEYFRLNQEMKIESVDIDTISHEAYHAVNHALEKYNLQNDEEYGAYMLGSLVNCIIEISKA